MQTVSAYDAKTNLSRLLDEVSQGKEFVITKHGVPVAELIPTGKSRAIDVESAVQALRNFQADHTLDGLSARELVEKGRRLE